MKGAIVNKTKSTFSSSPLTDDNVFVFDSEVGGITSVFTRTENGLVPAPNGSGAIKYLREDGVWAAPPDTIYNHASKAWVDKTALTNATVISNLSVDSLGHPTGWSTRILTPANIGAAPASHTHSQYIENETDPTVPAHVKSITTTEKSNWNTGFNKRITGLSITGTSTKTITITLADNTTVVGSFTDISSSGTTSDGNDYVTGGNFNTSTGQVTLTRIDGGTVVFNLDGRYETSFSKNTAFNKNFGTVAGTVSEGNHSHNIFNTSTNGFVPSSIFSGYQRVLSDDGTWNTIKGLKSAPIPVGSDTSFGGNTDALWSGFSTNFGDSYPIYSGSLITLAKGSGAEGAFQILSPKTDGSTNNQGRALFRQGDDRGFGPWQAIGPKPIKSVSIAAGGNYTLIAEDMRFWLKFVVNTSSATVTIPNALFGESDEIEGSMLGSGSVIFQEGLDFFLNKPAQLTTEIPEHGVFGMKFTNLNSGVLFGTLIPI